MAASAHVSRVRSMYKRILILHRFLPLDLRALGDQYVKDEFRRHKGASSEEVKSFMKEWEVKPFLAHTSLEQNPIQKSLTSAFFDSSIYLTQTKQRLTLSSDIESYSSVCLKWVWLLLAF